MGRRTTRIWALGAIALAAGASADDWDLSRDYSTTQNPNGVWAYHSGANVLPRTESWQGTGRPAWAYRAFWPNHIPAFWQATADGWPYYLTGDVTWHIYHNGNLLTEGRLGPNDEIRRGNPMPLDAGSGGPGALRGILVAAGDTIKFEIRMIQTCGEVAGLALNIAQECPADVDGDGFVTGDDFQLFVEWFETGDLRADFDGDGFLTGDDFQAFVTAFETGC